VEELKRKDAEESKKFEVEVVKHEICEIKRLRVQKNADELRATKAKCYEVSLDCTKSLKNNFAKVGAYSSEQNFIRGDLDGVIEWISGEDEAFEEILSDRGDFCAFAGARGAASILEKGWLRSCDCCSTRVCSLRRRHEKPFSRSFCTKWEILLRGVTEGRTRNHRRSHKKKRKGNS
jgi:hypothetical protein